MTTFARRGGNFSLFLPPKNKTMENHDFAIELCKLAQRINITNYVLTHVVIPREIKDTFMGVEGSPERLNLALRLDDKIPITNALVEEVQKLSKSKGMEWSLDNYEFLFRPESDRNPV